MIEFKIGMNEITSIKPFISHLRIGIKRRRILGVLIQKIKTHRGC
jgi:hypothetical protein